MEEEKKDQQDSGNPFTKQNVNSFSKGIYTDVSPLIQPEGTYRFALNCVNETETGDISFKSNAESNKFVSDFPNGFTAIGKIYVSEGETVIFSVNGNVSEIGICNELGYYTTIVNDSESINKLNFNINHQIQGIYRLRRGCDKTIYWTDNFNEVRFYILNRKFDFEINNKFDATLCSLTQKISSYPTTNFSVVSSDSGLLSGSYNIAIQYLDSDLNPTSWFMVSETIIIYNSEDNSSFGTIRGSTNEKNIYTNFPETNKNIEVRYSNLDKKYPFIRLALIQATNGSGRINGVTTTNPIANINGYSSYIFNGKNTYEKITIEEIYQDPLLIDTAGSIEHLENMLILGNITFKNNEVCEHQKLASKIKSNLVLKEIVLDKLVEGNHKRSTANLENVGYMPGEIYSFGIVYVFKDGQYSPVYHIPGANTNDSQTLMSKNNKSISKYTDRNNCNEDFWGVDSMGQSLNNTPIRHHRFPTRSEINEPFIKKTVVTEQISAANIYTLVFNKNAENLPDEHKYFEIKNVSFESGKKYYYQILMPKDHLLPDIKTVIFEKEIIPTIIITEGNSRTAYIVRNGGQNTVFPPNTVGHHYPITIKVICKESGWEQLLETINIDLTSGQKLPTSEEQEYTVMLSCDETTTNIDYEAITSKVMGISFSNIELPENCSGYFIVRCERKDEDKTVLDSGLLLPVINSKNKRFYNGFGNIIPTYTDENISTVEGTKGTDYQIRKDAYCLIYPEFLFNKKEYTGFSLKKEGDFKHIAVDGNYYNDKERIILGVQRDIMSGTSYNPEVHKHEDNDGFDLLTAVKRKKLIYETKRSFAQDVNNSSITNLKYISALSSTQLESTDINQTFFNISCDNNVAFFQIKENGGLIEKNLFDENLANALYSYDMTLGYGEGIARYIWTRQLMSPGYPPYAYDEFLENMDEDLKKAFEPYSKIEDTIQIYNRGNYKTINNYPYYYLTKSSIDNYVDFRSRQYINISKKLYTENTVEVFGGDTYIAPMSYFTSHFQNTKMLDRGKKNNTWKKIAATVLVVAAAAATIATAGAATPLLIASATLLAVGAAITIGATIAEQKRIWEIYDKEFEKGLKDCVYDDMIYNPNKNNSIFLSSSLENTQIPDGHKFYNGWSNDDEVLWTGYLLEDLWFETSVNMNWRHGNTAGLPDFINPLSNPTDSEIRNYFFNKLTVIDLENKSGRLYQGYALPEQYNINKDFLRRNMEKPMFPIGLEYDCCSDCKEKFPHRIYHSQQSFQEELTDNYKIFLPNNYIDIDGETGEITNIFKIKNNLFVHTKEAIWNLPKNYQERITDQVVSFLGTGEYFSIPPQKIVDDETGNSYGTQHKFSTLKTPFGYFFVCEKQNTICQFDGNSVEQLNQGLYYWLYDNIPIQQEVFKDNPSNPNFGSGFISVYDNKKDLIYFTKVYKEQTEQAITIDKSWTISYSLKDKAWISFHSFLPYFYFSNSQYFFSLKHGKQGVYRHNDIGNYGMYYGERKPFIIEFVINKSVLQNKITDDIKVFLETKKYKNTEFYTVTKNFFNKIVCYNSYQSTGELEIIVKDKESEDFINEQTKDYSNKIVADNVENIWNINDLKDIVIKKDRQLFLTSPHSPEIQQNYFIDKVVNNDILDYNKDWQDISSFRDKYLVVRLISDNFAEDIKMLLNFIIDTETISYR